jgi:hypothetical protein
MMRIPAILAALMAMMFFAPESRAGEEVPWANVPPAVQKTINENAGSGNVVKVEKETEDGKTVYEAKIKRADGSKTEIEVGEDGALMEADKD